MRALAEAASDDAKYPMEAFKPQRRGPGASLLQRLAEAALGEERLVRWRWNIRRWSMAHFWYRAHLPFRRLRWRLDSAAAARRFAKRENSAPTSGPAVVFGDFTGATGLARGAAYDLVDLRKAHDCLVEIDIRALLRGETPAALAEMGPVENAYFLCQPDMLRLILPLLRPEQIACSYRVGRWVWETPRFPDDWRFAETLFHEIWTPSEFSARTLRGGLSIAVRVKPHAVRVAPSERRDMRRRLDVSPAAFMGVAIMDVSTCPERKNPWAHVRAWKAAFGDDPEARLIVKIRTGRRTRLVLRELADLIGAAANIVLATEEMSAEEITGLQSCADVLLSLHRSEGYGLNIHEALACGTPVIATHFSANAEYGPEFSNYFGIGYQPVRYSDWTGHYAGGFEWADADISQAAQALRQVRDAWRAQRGGPAQPAASPGGSDALAA